MEYPRLILENLPFTDEAIITVVNESILRDTFQQDKDCIQNALKMLANPEYRIQNPDYTKEYIQQLVVVFTKIFLKYLEAKEYQ